MLSLVDVFVLEPAVWRELNAAAWVPVDHDPAPPGGARLLRPHGRRADRDDALRPGAAARASIRSTSRTASRPTSTGRSRGPRRAPPLGLPRDAFVVGHRGGEQGRPVAQVAGGDDRGVRRLPRPARRRDPLPAHRAPRAAPGNAPAVAAGRARRRPEDAVLDRRPVPLPLRPVPSGGDGGDLRVAGRAAERVDGRGLRADGARGAGLRRAGDRHRLHGDERGLRGGLEGRLRAALDRPGLVAGAAARRGARREPGGVLPRSTRSRAASSPPAPASTRSATTPTACWRSTGCRRSRRSPRGCPA